MLLFHRCGYLSAGSVCGYNSARSLKKAVTCGVEAPSEHARARGADSNQRACVEEVELVHRNEAGSERGQSDEDLEEQDEDARREAGHHHNALCRVTECAVLRCQPPVLFTAVHEELEEF